MVTLSKMLKEKDKAVICELPFCHTLEAEAMGGIINLGNEIAGPRAGGYVCTDVEEILNLPDMDFTKGRIQETLLACKNFVKKENMLYSKWQDHLQFSMC